MAKANAAKRRTLKAAAASVIEDVQDHEAADPRSVAQDTRGKSVVKSEAEEESAPKGESTLARAGEALQTQALGGDASRALRTQRRRRERSLRLPEVRNDPSSALQKDTQYLRAVEQATQGKSAMKGGVEGEFAPRRESTARASTANTEPGWRHIGRAPGAPDPALTESDPSSRRPPQLPTEVCERIIDWLWHDSRVLKKYTLVCKAWTPSCRYQMQRRVTLYDRSHVQGYARVQPHLFQHARSVFVAGAANDGERAPIPGHACHDGRGQAWRLDIARAIWKPSDLHPLLFVHLSAFSSLTTLRLVDVTFPKVREFGRLVCALPSVVRLRCWNVLFTSAAPCASLGITHSPPPVRLTDLAIFSINETASKVEANKSLIEHVCAAGVAADLQRFNFSVWPSSESKYLGVYREPLHELFKQCSRSLRYLNLSPDARPGKDVEADAISDTIVVLEALNFETVGYAWMRRILESYVSKNLREVSIVVDRPRYSENAETKYKGLYPLSRRTCAVNSMSCSPTKDYEKLHHVFLTFSN
ncbi:hypothetical protein WOLCODRAFT_151829 [Wolfiporia cocos MD-104 SS10]|uniref:F-box domain-containing protein n=1 Tax=Wolfiporia cocos (strain MD-104) TaxID=742152 RepID=A0A2H3JYF8_WOLCO|nr:hypothetical protein WOLCODRAFT_151829 [Wolfiporia cocos MD-104 SS10]